MITGRFRRLFFLLDPVRCFIVDRARFDVCTSPPLGLSPQSKKKKKKKTQPCVLRLTCREKARVSARNGVPIQD